MVVGVWAWNFTFGTTRNNLKSLVIFQKEARGEYMGKYVQKGGKNNYRKHTPNACRRRKNIISRKKERCTDDTVVIVLHGQAYGK